MKRLQFSVLIIFYIFMAGCTGSKQLIFPRAPLDRTAREIRYDVNGNNRADFALQADGDNRSTILAYDVTEDSRYDRTYRINDYAPGTVPHLIILLDSIPFQYVLDFYNAGHFSWFPPPQKVIAPFPTLSAVIFNQMLHAPPLIGTNNYYYDQRTNAMSSRFWEHTKGEKDTWQRYLHYDADYLTEVTGFLKTRQVYQRELECIKRTFDSSPDRITVVYAISSAGMVCRYGLQGIRECLEELERLCLQLLWERQGALKISITSDHGHNLMKSEFVPLSSILADAGFKVRDKIETANDVVIDTEGLVTYAGLHTQRPQAVADVLLKQSRVQLAMYLEADRVIVRDDKGSAAIEKKNGRLRYIPVDRDVLSYSPIIDALSALGKVDREGFAAEDDWFAATVDHTWPDAPSRIWDAFHGSVICPSDLMITLNDGYMSGIPLFKSFITMASSHGGLNQVNSATFLLSMTGRAVRPLRTRDILKAIEPEYVPAIRSGR